MSMTREAPTVGVLGAELELLPASIGEPERLNLTERVVPGAAFGLLDVLAIRSFLSEVQRTTSGAVTAQQVLFLAHRGVYMLFVSLAVALFMVRPPARSSDRRFSSWLFAVVGTFGLTAAPVLPPGPLLFQTGMAGAVFGLTVSVLALGLAVVTLATLGHSFGITPQARDLVTGGPYRIVRHPLYLCESMAILALALASGRTTSLVATVVVVGCQFRRAWLEERLLRRAFPEYEFAFRGVRHLVPGLY
jgi:protein-S-isoprenylcysteine O-methyltransferase Ste14